jgi:hypothetical protein
MSKLIETAPHDPNLPVTFLEGDALLGYYSSGVSQLEIAVEEARKRGEVPDPILFQAIDILKDDIQRTKGATPDPPLPEWAQGLDWEGWGWINRNTRYESMRQAKGHHAFRIYENGLLTHDFGDASSDLPCESVAAAKSAADAMIHAMKGEG